MGELGGQAALLGAPRARPPLGVRGPGDLGSAVEPGGVVAAAAGGGLQGNLVKQFSTKNGAMG